jgi:ATP-binding cassette subfamily B protein
MPPEAPSPKAAEYDGWATLRRFLPYLWPLDRKDLRFRIAGALLLVLLAKAVTLATPLAMKKVVDTMAAQGNPLMWVALSFVIAFVAARLHGTAFDNTRNIVFERVGQEATQHLAEDTFARLHQLSLRFHLGRRTGEVTKTIERGTKSIDAMLYFMLFNIAPTVLELDAVGVIFYTLFGWPLVIATAITVAIYIATTRWITEWRTTLRKQMNDLDGTALARAVDSLLNYETVKYFGAEARERERYGRAAGAYAEAAIKSENSLGLLNIAQAVIMNALMLFALGFTVWQWSKGRLSVGDLVAVQTYLTQLFRPLDMLGMVYRTIRQGLIDMAAMFKLIDTDLEVADAPGAPALAIRKPTVAFDNVVFGYEPERTILHGLSFEVPAGAQVAIVGPSGAGKSTISRLLFRFYDVNEGAIRIDGQDLRDVTQDSIRRAIGVVPQDTVLFNDSILYNIAYGRPGAASDEIEEAARHARIDNFIASLPDGYGSPVGERGLKLSGGEKQRVAIARVILKEPRILLFDEATSALDTKTEREIQASLDEVSENRTTLIIAHRLSTVIHADEILVLDEGRVVERGNHAQLIAHHGVYDAMWQRQQEADARAAALAAAEVAE